MPIRELECVNCNHTFNEILTFSEEKAFNEAKRISQETGAAEPIAASLGPCPKCTAVVFYPTERVFATDFALKGRGWTGKIRKS